MGMSDEGYFFWKEGPVLAMLVVVEESGKIETVYRPTEAEIENVCERYGFDFDKTIRMVRNKEPYTHTIVIEAELYRKSFPGGSHD